MLTAFFGLTGAVIFGSADFLGGLAAKRISAVLVTAVAATSGLVVLLLLLPFVAGEWSASAVIWGALSGITGALAISLLYACLAIGPMSILSPLTAVVSAIVPMTAGLLGGERFLPIGYWALVLALVAVVLVGFVPERGAVRPRLLGIAMAIGSGTMIGAFMILIDQTPSDSGLVPLVMNRAVNGGIMFTVVGLIALRTLHRRRARAAAPVLVAAGRSVGAAELSEPVATSDRLALRTGLKLAVACGVIDVTANFLLLLGLRFGDLSAVSVLTAMYPAGTILLAAVVLKERIAPVQWFGLALALGAAGMLAIA
ncbi:EamA/RhaT family transporter [Cryobacterium sp. TMT1-3]|uniref:EamA family transporter n=1 Tax=Cryobacterium sp. TMT1-3 TaxID=1259237 RepID=UPI00106CA5D6|nr:EamA family transporter [Cryobacterium sp. TMT1-3]TFC29613.1 EamA/RhaT family transporter [Cryobacterium sp. TMT1-3]